MASFAQTLAPFAFKAFLNPPRQLELSPEPARYTASPETKSHDKPLYRATKSQPR
jgi:hypothetical protein